MLDKTRQSEFVGLRFDGGFNDLLAFSGIFVAATGYVELRPIKAKFVFVPKDLYHKHKGLADRFNGTVIEDEHEILTDDPAPSLRRSFQERIEDVKEATRQLKREQDEFATSPRYN